jgi:hypothetical protein
MGKTVNVWGMIIQFSNEILGKLGFWTGSMITLIYSWHTICSESGIRLRISGCCGVDVM